MWAFRNQEYAKGTSVARPITNEVRINIVTKIKIAGPVSHISAENLVFGNNDVTHQAVERAITTRGPLCHSFREHIHAFEQVPSDLACAVQDLHEDGRCAMCQDSVLTTFKL